MTDTAEQTNPVINSFRGDYFFLSNFYPAETPFCDRIYPTSEHAFQAAKCPDRARTQDFVDLDKPGDAKKLGKAIEVRADWDKIKRNVMYRVLMAKFTFNGYLAQELVLTGNAPLVEGNNWGDTYWGVCNNRGENQLGQILMRVRDELQRGT